MTTRKIFTLSFVLLLCCGCEQMAPKAPEPSAGHLKADAAVPSQEKIPELVQQAPPALPEPAAPEQQEKYTVVVNEVPVKELLFALARDAQINVDVDPRIEGVVTLNAVEQTLPQLLERISNQVDMRYEMKDDNLFITPDTPFLRSYKINYLNMARDTNTTISISTQISGTAGAGVQGGAGGAGGGGRGGSASTNSTTDVKSVATNHFWGSLVRNVQAILGEEVGGGAAGAGGEVTGSANVIPNVETGVLTVRATERQHREVQKLIDSVTESARRQVMIQATIAEVTLSDQYQAGIDWSFLNQNGLNLFDLGSVTGAKAGLPGVATSFLLNYTRNDKSGDQVVSATLRLLEQFGNVSVLSSPQIMALNNQTAVLKVVDNRVYFSVESETSQTQGVQSTTVNTTAYTVPVGIVMGVTPQIGGDDTVVLNVRPSISRVAREVADPNPVLKIPNAVPEIRVREMESVLRMNDGQIAVLGGLMQDDTNNSDSEVPGLSRLPGLGDAFRTRNREYNKTELVIFLRPTVVRNPSLEADLNQYKPFLKTRP